MTSQNGQECATRKNVDLKKVAQKGQRGFYTAAYGAVHILYNAKIRYDTRCYFNARSKADMSLLNLPHGTNN